MLNPLTGKLMPDLYEVSIYHGKNIIFTVTLKTTSEEEAVAQAAKQLNTKVKKLNG
jgi:hypothetical protein